MLFRSFGQRWIYNAEQARALARSNIAGGADFVGANDGDGPQEMWAAYADEAHKAGKAVILRCLGPQTRGKSCVLAGADVMIHTGQIGNEISKNPEVWKDYVGEPSDPYCDMDPAKEKDMIAFLLQHNTAVEPDFIAMDRSMPMNWKRVQQEDRDFANLPNLRSYYPEYAFRQVWENVKSPETYMKPDEIQRRTLGFKNHAWFLKHYVDAGGRLVAASDDPQTPPGLGVHQEMTAFVEDVGLTPMQAIQAGTSWVADGFKIADVGRVQAGMLADILIVDADPSQDIMNLRKINMVLKDGKVLDRAFHADYKGSMFNNSTLHDFDANVEGSDWADALKRATWQIGRAHV